ncbi:PucR family transcriptional regulator [Amycolatopsis saalfeldensis]|uniref:PucR C-terminal helix-turn-helix domain-containing protein n=1 Tax=Amycolatopsis saalfeldensis TaxID=394193 RepID=A0A1H8U1T0_9PSEU|nr:helix-turn-helix domain-containing protein [Amycolatopsis saalfeldensis]SEO97209.1 PucR C-terminal helix-turn-helix domain-containing protein [Amycolatopsis saalfeldensis]
MMTPEASESGTAPGSDGVTLDRLRQILGPLVLEILCAPRGATGQVGPQVIYGPGEPVPSEVDGLLLMVGMAPDDDATFDAIRRAGEARYCAVALKARGADLTAAVAAAKEATVALLVVPDDMAWRRFDSLITAATSASSPAMNSYSTIGIGDLFSLANAIAYQVGGAISIEDPTGRVLAYSNLPHQLIDEIRRQGILGRQTPARPTNVDEYQLVLRAEEPIYFDVPEPDHMSRLAVAVRVGPQVLGLIWALDDTPRLGEGARAAIEEAAKVTALHLLRARSHRDPDRWSKSEALVSLLNGSSSAEVAAAQLGIGAATPTAVLAIARTEPEEIPGLSAARVLDLVGLYCEAWHPQSVCAAIDDTVYALLPLRTDSGVDQRIKAFADNIVATVGRTMDLALRVGIGVSAQRHEEVPECRRTADHVLRALSESDGQLRVATATDLRSMVMLLEWADSARVMRRLPPGPVEAMSAHDQQNSTQYAHTVLTYLAHFGETIPAAAALRVHENTLRYRIRRVHELFGIDLRNPDTRLVTWLQLRLSQLGD